MTPTPTEQRPKMSKGEEDWKMWLLRVMQNRPKGNMFLDSPRGIEVGKLCIDFDRQNYSWRRSDTDTFCIDVQLFVKYKLSDDEILFAMKMQAGVDEYRKHSDERNAYAEFMRGLDKMRKLEFQKHDSD